MSIFLMSSTGYHCVLNQNRIEQNRIDFKILVLTFKSLHDLAPAYITYLLIPHQPLRNLRSRKLLIVTESRIKTKKDRAFAIRAPKLSNNLPETIRSAESVSIFPALSDFIVIINFKMYLYFDHILLILQLFDYIDDF